MEHAGRYGADLFFNNKVACFMLLCANPSLESLLYIVALCVLHYRMVGFAYAYNLLEFDKVICSINLNNLVTQKFEADWLSE